MSKAENMNVQKLWLHLDCLTFLVGAVTIFNYDCCIFQGKKIIKKMQYFYVHSCIINKEEKTIMDRNFHLCRNHSLGLLGTK